MKILIFCKIFFFSFYALAADEGRFIHYKSLPPQALQNVDAIRSIVTDNRIKETKGTAFFITPHILVTAYHVIKEWKDNLSPENGPSDLFILGAKRHFRFKRIIGFLEEHDLALIEVENTAADSATAPFLTLSHKPIQKGDLVYTFGYADGMLTTIESEVVDLNEGFSLYKGAIILEFEITKPSGKDTAGMSGSPVINNKGEVVGVYLRALVRRNPELLESKVELDRAYIASVAHLEELLPMPEGCWRPWQLILMAFTYPYAFNFDSDCRIPI